MKSPSVLAVVIALLCLMLPSPALQGQISFTGPELLGRPTDRSVTLNVVASAAMQAYVEYGTVAGGPYSSQTSTVSASANQPLVIKVGGLNSDTSYFYRLVYKPSSSSSWTTRDEHSFHTQRPRGASFTFTVMADSHINIVFGNSTLYQTALQNVARDHPDFHLDLGDTFAMDNVSTQAQANTAYLNARAYFGLISPSVPVFLALGNHEQEEGWHLNDTATPDTSPPVMSTNARNQYYLNPNPLLDSFYSGNTDGSITAVSGNHLPEDYYAWEWGDALFVVIDPYWNTTTKPYVGDLGGGEATDAGSGDRWDWTLGWTQYQWLKQTLENSTARYKFIFAHQVAGGLDDYGRGGANAVPFVEWGGYNDDGTTWAFDSRRAGWPAPVHQLLVNNHVTALFHAHDHEFAYEKRDGIVYQLVPMPSDASYGYGFQNYHPTDPYTLAVLPNSGHLRVTVTSAQVTVDYVRAFLSGAGTNGQLAYRYTIGGTGSGNGADTTPPSVTATTPANGATGVSTTAPITATFSEAINAATLTTKSFVLNGPGNASVTGTVTYNTSTHVATFAPSAALATATTYSATVAGGTGGITDLAGNALASAAVWSFTTAMASPPIGLTTVGSALDSGDSGILHGSRVTATAGGTVRSMSVFVGAVDSTSTHRQYQVAIYTDNAGRPGALIATSATGTLVANAWNTIAISATVQANNHYWLFYNTNGTTAAVNNMRYSVGASGVGVHSTRNAALGSWPTTLAAPVLTTAQYSIYATVSP